MISPGSVLRHPLTLGFLAALTLLLSAFLARAHVREVAAFREQALPLLAQLPVLEQRTGILGEQVEVTELDAAVKTGSLEERVRMSILPAASRLDSALAAFEALRTDLSERRLLGSLSPIDVGEERKRPDGFLALPLTLQYTLRGEGVKDVLAFLKLGGLLTVGDALTTAEKSSLLRATEEENPAGVVALEQFFGTDLASYAREPKPVEEQLRRSLPGEGFQTLFRTVLEQSLLGDARRLMGGSFGRAADALKFWPTPFIALDAVTLTPGKAEDWFRLDLKVSLLRRSS